MTLRTLIICFHIIYFVIIRLESPNRPYKGGITITCITWSIISPYCEYITRWHRTILATKVIFQLKINIRIATENLRIEKNTGYSGTKLYILVMKKNKNIFACVETVLSHGETSILKFSLFCYLRHSELAFTWYFVGNLWFQYYYKTATSQN